jgi:hypothetical protein
MRRNSRNILGRRPNPLRELVADQRKNAENLRTLARAEQLQEALPAIIENQVGEHMQKLEDKLLQDFKDIGKRAVEESTAALNQQLHGRIESLEKISALQSKTLVNLRDSSRVAEQKVSTVVNSIERALSTAVPGFQLEPPAHPPSAPYEPAVAPQLEPGTEVVKLDSREIDEPPGKYGHCPSCTSPNIRRAYRHGLWDELLRLFFIAPFRCRACRHKFYRF